MNKIIEIILAGLAVVMLYPLYLSILGIIGYYNNGNSVNIEGGQFVFYVIIFSSVLWLPYLILSSIYFKRIRKVILIGSSVPFLATGLIGLLVFVVDLVIS